MSEGAGSLSGPSRQDPSTLRRRLRIHALSAFFGIIVLYATLLRDYIAAFSLYGDDAGVALNSALPYFPINRWSEWFTKGFSEYAIGYPDWGAFGNNTLKPVVNFSFFLQGLIAPRMGPQAFLIGSYLAPAITAAVLVYVFHRYADTSPLQSTVCSLVVATSPVWIGSLFAGVDTVNTFALMFSVAAIGVLPIRGQHMTLTRGLVLVLLQLLAILSHETAIILPAICALYLHAFRETRPRWVEFIPFAAAASIWLVLRFIVLQSHTGIYALELGRPLHKAMVYWVGTAVVPLDIEATWMARGFAPLSQPEVSPLLLAWMAIVVAANAAFLLGGLVRLREWKGRRNLSLIAAFAVATVPHLPTADLPACERFAGLSLVTGLLLALVFFEDRRRLVVGFATLVLAAQGLYLGTAVLQHKRDNLVDTRLAAAFQTQVNRAVAEHRPNQIYVVNDRFGFYGVPAAIRLYGWPATGFDVIPVNNLVGTTAAGGSVDVAVDGGTVDFRVAAPENTTASFLGATDVDFNVRSHGLRYRLLQGTEDAPAAFEARGPLLPGVTLVVGFDPQQNRLLDPIVISP